MQYKSAWFVYQKIQFQLHIEFDTPKHGINTIISLLVSNTACNKNADARNRSIQFNRSIQHLFTIPVTYQLKFKWQTENGNWMVWMGWIAYRQLKISFNLLFQICDTHWDCRITPQHLCDIYMCTLYTCTHTPIHFVCAAKLLCVCFREMEMHTVICCGCDLHANFVCCLPFSCDQSAISKRRHASILHALHQAKAIQYFIRSRLW